MKSLDLKVEYYCKALDQSQRGLYIATLLTFFAFLMINHSDSENLLKLPIIESSVQSIKLYAFILILMFIASGLLVWLSVSKAKIIFQSVNDPEIKAALRYHPSIMTSSFRVKNVICFLLGCAWVLPLITAWDLESYVSIPIMLIMCLPIHFSFILSADMEANKSSNTDADSAGS